MEIEKDSLESILKSRENSEMISRIISVEWREMSEEGDNYVSQLMRANIRGVLGSGEIFNRTFVLKIQPGPGPRLNIYRNFPFFAQELQMYSRILPAMKKLLNDNGVVTSSFSPRFLGNLNQELLILEDLKIKGYYMGNRGKGLTLEEGIVVMKELGKFHGASYALHTKGNLSPDFFRPSNYASKRPIADIHMKRSMTNIVAIIRSSWSSEWLPIAEKIERLKDTFTEELDRIRTENNNPFTVLNHGDFWVNNIMFKQEEGYDKPTKVKFIDFQLCHFNSYAWDLVFLLATSLRIETKVKHFERLISVYRESAIRVLEAVGLESGVVPSIPEVEKELKRLGPFSLFTLFSVTPVIVASSGDALQCDKNDLSFFSNPDMFNTPTYKAILEAELKKCIEIGIL